MSNQSIVNRMIESCDRFDGGQINVGELEQEVESLVSSLESSPRRQIEPIFSTFWDELCNGCSSIDCGYPKEGWQEIAAAIATFKSRLASFLDDQADPLPN